MSEKLKNVTLNLDIDNHGSMPTESGPTTPFQSLEPKLDINFVDESPEDNPSNTSADSDDDIEPAKLVEKYLSLQWRLYSLQPELVQIGHQKQRGSKSTTKMYRPNIEPSTSEAARILRRINVINSDVLFDRDEANERWILAQNDLAREASERRRLQLDNGSKPAGGRNAQILSAVSPSALSEDGAMDMFGDLFSTIPESATGADTGISTMASTSPHGAAVTIRDFGKWTGLGPHRILEEACKAR